MGLEKRASTYFPTPVPPPTFKFLYLLYTPRLFCFNGVHTLRSVPFPLLCCVPTRNIVEGEIVLTETYIVTKYFHYRPARFSKNCKQKMDTILISQTQQQSLQPASLLRHTLRRRLRWLSYWYDRHNHDDDGQWQEVWCCVHALVMGSPFFFSANRQMAQENTGYVVNHSTVLIILK